MALVAGNSKIGHCGAQRVDGFVPYLTCLPSTLPSIFYLSTPDLAGCYRTVWYSRDGKRKGREGAGIAPYQDKGVGVDGLDNPGKDQKKKADEI